MAGVHWLVIPALVPVVLLSVLPLAQGIYSGFTNARAGRTRSSEFVGLDNYVDLLTNGYFWQSFRIGITWSISVTLLQLVLSLGLALLLNSRLRFRWLARTLAILPWAVPPVVIAYTWKLVYRGQGGMLNHTLEQLRVFPTDIAWLHSTFWALPAVILVGVWMGMSQTTIVLLAGLQSVPHELHEAAALDGAGAFRSFAAVTWPEVRGVATAIGSLNFIWNFNEFGLVYVLTEGGPGASTQMPMLFAYQEAFRYGNYGAGAAIGNLMVIIIAALFALYYFLVLRRKA